ncbi:YaaR family protein [Paenibacillus thermoaerophilus]|uniref:YaaR family protein n=1 Tax=Paenibacillus thermoaerophilus TaxID=1215385 RepID=A0ABW2V9F5_9BACL|nr:YaaR family protein [Paenibacillus thermoaerophilus]TMV09481.1 DUF327 family protein [Paenibacillus thermoaerophilus]
MKIDPGLRPFGKGLVRPDAPVQPQVQQKSFSDFMRSRNEAAGDERLQQMLKDITVQGERLLKSMTIRELRIYRQMVKHFLELTVRRGVGLKETKGWDRRGRTKRYKLLEEIDAKLLELADDLLETEQGRIELLQKIGDIRGMLINIWF